MILGRFCLLSPLPDPEGPHPHLIKPENWAHEAGEWDTASAQFNGLEARATQAVKNG